MASLLRETFRRFESMGKFSPDNFPILIGVPRKILVEGDFPPIRKHVEIFQRKFPHTHRYAA